MARQRSELLSAAGTVFEIVKAIVDEVLTLGGNDEDVRKILKSADIRRKIAELLIEVIRPAFKVVVDYTKSLVEMVIAVIAGHYDCVNNDITVKHFPVKGEGRKEVELVLFHFGKVMTSEQVIAEMAKAGYRPARIEELLALKASQPELQKEFPIMALGSVWRDPDSDRRVPYLGWFGTAGCLDLNWFEGEWGGHCRFAAVRNAS